MGQSIMLLLWVAALAHVMPSTNAHGLDDDCVKEAASVPPPGYDPTRCHPNGNATSLPSQCLSPTWSLDPPCPRCWTNEAPDYVAGSPTSLTPTMRGQMQAALQAYLDDMLTQRPASAGGSGTVFSGLGGRALLLLKLH